MSNRVSVIREPEAWQVEWLDGYRSGATIVAVVRARLGYARGKGELKRWIRGAILGQTSVAPRVDEWGAGQEAAILDGLGC